LGAIVARGFLRPDSAGARDALASASVAVGDERIVRAAAAANARSADGCKEHSAEVDACVH
jgi:hypothetical protein